MTRLATTCVVLTWFAAAACGDGGSSENENEVITTVTLNFAPAGGGAAVVAAFNDLDGDGGAAPTIDAVNLVNTTSYTLNVRFENKLASPPVDITDEVRDEQNFHLLLFTGSAVVGPATNNTVGPITQAYADTDGNGLPVGLSNTITAKSGTGQLVLTLRHMPPEEPPIKSADTLAQVKTGGVDSIGGSTDAQITYTVNVP
jgi:hypothetical protein